MGMTYTAGSDVAALEPRELSERLMRAVEAALVWLRPLGDEVAGRPEREGKWSAKQVIGHLTDSAVNNLGRVIRMQIAPGQTMSGYEQEEWVRLQHYSERGWNEVLDTWIVLNGQMAWTVAHVEKSKLAQTGSVEGDELTLGFLIEDYIAHMEHHLRAIQSWAG